MDEYGSLIGWLMNCGSTCRFQRDTNFITLAKIDVVTILLIYN